MHFFYVSPEETQREIAWEVYGKLPQMNSNQSAYVFDGEVCSCNLKKEDYYTIVKSGLDQQVNRGYSKRLSRVLRKASSEAELITIQDEDILKKSFRLFLENEGSRDFMSYELFEPFVLALLNNESATLYSICYDNAIAGTLVALRSASQINLRYYTNRRDYLGSGHVLLSSIIEKELSTGTKIVDLSGISVSADPKMHGINEFKRQFGGTLIRFRSTSSESINS